MEEDVYMKCPEGIDLVENGWNRSEDCMELLQTIYGTKQAARQYWKTFMGTMEKKDFEKTHADSCLLKRKDHNGTVVICVYVDDCLLTGDRAAIEATIEEIDTTFETRRLGSPKEYIGCTFIELADGSKKLLQPEMIKKLDIVFGKEATNLRDANVPMGPGITVIRPKDDDEKLNTDNQRKFRSGVGMLLYLVKHSRPDFSTGVRELAKVMDGTTEEHLKLLYRVVNFVLNTRTRGIVMKPCREDGVIAYVDSDYAGDKDNRKSITGYMIYVYGVPVAWKSKQQGRVLCSERRCHGAEVTEDDFGIS
jgi:hypothetical protein